MLYFIKNFSSGKSVGGKTGSKRVKLKRSGQLFQLKPSILDNTWLRRIKARNADRENFGEVIAACIGNSLLPMHTPKVSLVYDKYNKRILIASEYLTGEKVQTLDEFAISTSDVQTKNSTTHVKFVNRTANPAEGEYSVDGMSAKELRKDLARAIAISALTGDHDVNPGNMLVIQNKDGTKKVARIDFGHAFHDLLNAPKLFGGHIINKKNRIMDFFNRDTIAGFPLPAQSKFWRSYQGLIPSQELVDALRELSSPDKKEIIKKGIDKAEAEFNTLKTEIITQKDTTSEKHLKHSLAAIYNNISSPQHKIKNPKSADTDYIIKKTFNGIRYFVEKNRIKMNRVANIMQLQVDIDNLLINKTLVTDRIAFKDDLRKILQDYEKLISKQSAPATGRFSSRSAAGKLQWLKTSQETNAFNGSLKDYLKLRHKQLQKKDKLAEQNPSGRPIQDIPLQTKDDKVTSATSGVQRPVVFNSADADKKTGTGKEQEPVSPKV